MFQKSGVVIQIRKIKKKRKKNDVHTHNNYGDTRLGNLIYSELELRTLVKI